MRGLICEQRRSRSVPLAAWEATPALTPAQAQSRSAFCGHLARLAVRSLYQELVLYPKPGLVSLVDNGSHADMDAGTFMRSLFGLRHYFFRIARAGQQGQPFAVLQELAIQAEQRMLRSTGGINTHRGAIFVLGMLCAALAYCRGHGIALRAEAVRAALLIQWGDALTVHSNAVGQIGAAYSYSHGQQVAQAHAVGGAREEGALGFPSVFELALPQLHATLAQGRGWHAAKIDTLFALMAHINDTNIYHRGGAAGAALVRQRSRAFLDAGGTAGTDWPARALACHQDFVAQRLSPGGAADLLAAACLLHQALPPSTAIAFP